MWFGEKRLSTGTAFVCQSSKGPVLLTNWHNLSGRNPHTRQPLSSTAAIPDSIRIIHNAEKLGQWFSVTEPLYSNSNPRWIEHPTLGDRADFVALPLINLENVRLYPHDLLGGPAIAIYPSEQISVVGFPFGLQVGGS